MVEVALRVEQTVVIKLMKINVIGMQIWKHNVFGTKLVWIKHVIMHQLH